MLFPLTVETKAQAAAGDKVKHRLEQLDDMEEGSVKETLNLNQKDYVRKIDELNKSLVAAWDNDQRVKALKIAIQVRGGVVWVWSGNIRGGMRKLVVRGRGYIFVRDGTAQSESFSPYFPPSIPPPSLLLLTLSVPSF